MNPKEFFNKVTEMREMQKAFFSTKSSSALIRSKELEREIDAEIARVNAILGKLPKPIQGSLFGEDRQ